MQTRPLVIGKISGYKSILKRLDWRAYDITAIKIYDNYSRKRLYYRGGKRTVSISAESFRRSERSGKGIWNHNFQPLSGRSGIDKRGHGVFRVCKAGCAADGTAGIKIY
jgi:hypothetical protein